MFRRPPGFLRQEALKKHAGLFMVAATRLAEDRARWQTLVKATAYGCHLRERETELYQKADFVTHFSGMSSYRHLYLESHPPPKKRQQNGKMCIKHTRINPHLMVLILILYTFHGRRLASLSSTQLADAILPGWSILYTSSSQVVRAKCIWVTA